MPKRQNSLLPPTLSIPTPTPDRHIKSSRTESALNNAINTINVVQELVPFDLARGVLAAVSGVLGLIRNSIANQEDFAELAEQCHKIGLVVWRATATVPEERISLTIQRAIGDLKESVGGIKQEIDGRLQKGLGSRVFHITVNQELIAGWQRDLDRLLSLFNTELNISANLKLDELMTLLEEFRHDSKGEAPVPDALPVKPPIFMGRDDLVMNTVKSLLQFQHVALIGPGGMGKTSIARAVLNDDSIVEKFSGSRHFVRYDDMDASQITYATFLNRIARALGISSSKANMHSLVTKALSSSGTLIVLDNAESFLDAEKDAGRIAEAIDEFGARPNVAIMLTSRTIGLPPNLPWERLRVPALEELPACDAFRVIYTRPIEQSILAKLLSAIDFHPLSINLLAQAAVQNQWSPEDLIAAWDRQHALLLDNGGGKIQSITVTIELSLNSPSLKKLGDTVRDLLQVIAFLPQGISQMRMTKIFESDSTITQCADVLCKHSLTYYKGDFITMLAPIRLYISMQNSNTTPAHIPLLSALQAYYYDQLAVDPVDKMLIRCEDINIEHILAFGLIHSSGNETISTLSSTTQFLSALSDYKPRPTSLLPIISALQPAGSINSLLCFGRRTNKPFLIIKGNCINLLAALALEFGQLTEAKDLFEEARDMFLACGFVGRFYLQIPDIGIGEVYATLGDYIKAEAAYKAAIQRRSYLFKQSPEDRQIKAYLARCLGGLRTIRGQPGAVELCLAGLPDLRRVGDSIGVVQALCSAGYAELAVGKNESARRYFQDALSASTEEEDSEYHIGILQAMAEVSYRQGNGVESREFREKIHDIVQRSPNRSMPYAIEAESVIAAHIAMDGDVQEARSTMHILIQKVQKMNIDIKAVNCFYLAACIEMRGKDFQKAAEYFTHTIDCCKAVSEVHSHARSLRALGEIALVNDDTLGARARFEEALSLCDFMGIRPDALYNDQICYTLSDVFTGWDKFLASRPVITS